MRTREAKLLHKIVRQATGVACQALFFLLFGPRPVLRSQSLPCNLALYIALQSFAGMSRQEDGKRWVGLRIEVEAQNYWVMGCAASLMSETRTFDPLQSSCRRLDKQSESLEASG